MVIRESGMAGQEQVKMFSDVEAARGMGQADVSMGEEHTYCLHMNWFFFPD